MASFGLLWSAAIAISSPAAGASSNQVSAKTTLSIKAKGGHVEATLVDAQGNPITDAKVTVTATMTEMDMGAESAIAIQSGKGFTPLT